jgi:hypothetical protein
MSECRGPPTFLASASASAQDMRSPSSRTDHDVAEPAGGPNEVEQVVEIYEPEGGGPEVKAGGGTPYIPGGHNLAGNL